MKLNDYETKHIALLRDLAPECMVLLKSNGDFPLDGPCEIALYGGGARRTIKGGTGSGDVNSRFYTTVEQGLEAAGFTVTTKGWMDRYDEIQAESHQAFVADIKEQAKAAGIPALFFGMGAVMPEPEYDLPLDGAGDTAIYVLARISGEGSDRRADKGDLKLTDTEVRDILALKKKYRRFLLALNVGGVVDLSPVMEVENILILSQLGVVTGDALADVVLGRSYPSGKLASTWTAWEDYCTVGDFGQKDDTRYREGVYVGYRYFDSVGKTPLFPFGYGLGYTAFALRDVQVQLDGTEVQASVNVANTGARPGKETAQVYVSVPAGKLDQPAQALAAFEKSGELAPGESETLTLRFSMEQLASFDESRNCSILEPGDYILRAGFDSREQTACAVVRLDREVVVERLSDAGGNPDFTDWKPERAASADCTGLPVLELSADAFQPVSTSYRGVDPKALETVQGLSDDQLAYFCSGNYRTGEGQSFIGMSSMRVPGAAGETTDRIPGVPALVMADGPAGLRLTQHYGKDEEGVYDLEASVPAAFLDFLDEDLMKMMGQGAQTGKERHGEIFDQYCTAIPIGTALAQSWNVALCRACGDLVGSEMERFGVHLWLAPAFNIHRSPLCGRNFEYYSEDPLISGRIAAAITQGVQAHPGCGVTIKHFCCNNQETNRFRSNSAVSRRALRDIYLKGFEICVKESHPAALMTSYNLLNGIHTSERADLLDGILRGEWGYEGLVMSDWVTPATSEGGTSEKYPCATAARSVAAGNDVMMPGGQWDHDGILAALASGELPRAQLERCAARVVQAARALTGNP